MKLVRWTDEKGFVRRAWLRDGDPDSMGPQGIPYDPPDLDRLDWEEIKRELHNLFVANGLVTWDDVQREQNAITSALRTVVLRRIISLYRQEED